MDANYVAQGVFPLTTLRTAGKFGADGKCRADGRRTWCGRASISKMCQINGEHVTLIRTERLSHADGGSPCGRKDYVVQTGVTSVAAPDFSDCSPVALCADGRKASCGRDTIRAETF